MKHMPSAPRKWHMVHHEAFKVEGSVLIEPNHHRDWISVELHCEGHVRQILQSMEIAVMHRFCFLITEWLWQRLTA